MIFYTSFTAVIISILSICEVIHASPQRSVTELPNFTKLSNDEIRHLQNRGFGPTVPSAYTSPSAIEEYEDSHTASSHTRAVTYADESYENYPNVIPVKPKVQVISRPKNLQQQAQHFRPTPQSARERDPKEPLEEEEEIEEPDRLSLLLPQSKFICNNKNTGYYADEDLNCEVFHYCQDNAKHSWICPEGFTFHQVHLICMPPGGDNICDKSSQFHFVNEYLYKPVNLEEYQQKPNISLKYSERYYPENYYHDNEDHQDNHHRTSIRVAQDAVVPKSLLVDAPIRTTFRPETTLGQVFRSPNEVNIPLQHRRPQYVTQRFLNRE